MPAPLMLCFIPDASGTPHLAKGMTATCTVKGKTVKVAPPAAQAETAPFPLIDVTGRLTDFADTAALVETLDLIITVDTAVAHLAGALGKPVWILLPYSPDWRWMLGREDSPWYPTARLFRQTEMGEWQGVIEKVREALAATTCSHASILR